MQMPFEHFSRVNPDLLHKSSEQNFCSPGKQMFLESSTFIRIEFVDRVEVSAQQIFRLHLLH